jgi:alpha-galactosidase
LAASGEVESVAAETSFTHSSGLVVTRELRRFPTFEALEYRLRFRNSAERRLAPVSALHALNISFGEDVVEGNSVISAGGGLDDAFFPPRAFAIRTHRLESEAHAVVPFELTTEGGRSSNKDLPFFFIHNSVKQEGIFFAFGWSGQWSTLAMLDRQAGALRIRGRIPDINIALEPGEEIVGPTILIGFYRGKPIDGSNRLRRLIRKHYTPALSGQPYMPTCVYTSWWNIFGNYDESRLRQLADGAATLQQEYFELEPPWYGGSLGDFSVGLGNWEDVDKAKLPHGLAPIAEYTRSKGLKFGLWFEPERVAEGSRLAREHPNWILWDHSPLPSPWWAEFSPEHPSLKIRYGVLDLGRTDARQWVCDMMTRYIREHDVRYIKYDLNIDPLPYWKANDESDRQGMTQLRYMSGLYAVFDWLLQQHPDTVIEGCASGGRRIDLEMVRRCHTFWISDNHADTAISQFHLFGIHHFLPGNYANVQYILPLAHRTHAEPGNSALEYAADDLGFQRLFGGAMGMGGRVDLWSEADRQKAQRHVAIHKELRRYLMEDFYPLGDQPVDLKSWSGWQFLDPVEQAGFIQTFRTKTPESTQRFAIHKLDEGKRYRFSDPYSAQAFEITGQAAMTYGIEVTQEPMSSRVFRYERIS